MGECQQYVVHLSLKDLFLHIKIYILQFVKSGFPQNNV